MLVFCFASEDAVCVLSMSVIYRYADMHICSVVASVYMPTSLARERKCRLGTASASGASAPNT